MFESETMTKEPKTVDEPVEPQRTFEQELKDLLNRHSRENESNTPDWCLAEYLLTCLKAFDTAVGQRDGWHGRGSSAPRAV